MIQKARNGADAGAQAPAPPLPCLYSNNCTEEERPKLSPYQQRVAECLTVNMRHLVEQYGFERVGFVTLTTPDSPDWTEYQGRLHSAQTHLFKELFPAWILVFEFHKDGRIHCHAVVACRTDIRTGFDFALYLASRDATRSLGERRQLIRRAAEGSPNLRGLWSVLRRRLPGYGFGRHELIPIHKSADAIAWYVGGYIRKSLEGREAKFKGKRFVRYSRGWRCASVNFAWNNEAAWLWRQKLAAFAQALGVEVLEDMKHACGRYWAYNLRDKITAINDLEEYPTLAHARKDGWVDAGTYGDFLYAIEVGGRTELVESGRMPAEQMLHTAEELARAVVQANPVSHAVWKKWRKTIRGVGGSEPPY